MAVLETGMAEPLGDGVTSSAQPVWTTDGIDYLETVHQDNSVPSFKTKHIYFHGTKKKFRVRYDRIVSFDPYDDGFGVMREAQTAKPGLPDRGRVVPL